MSESDPIRICVSHTWSEHDDYHRFFEYIGEVDSFFYSNLSKPLAEPPTSRLDVEQRLGTQIEAAEILIVLVPVWEENAPLIELQIALARRHRRPIIALRASGAQTFPKALETLVDDVVIWNERLIVDAILRHARGDHTNRFEVLDFP
ncbi:MAG: hypothetical protein AAF184_08820 [Pseudomonadota bacterium]